MINRRRFIKYSFIGTSAVSAGYLGYKAASPLEKSIKNILIADLAGLKVKLVDINAYAKEIADKNDIGLTFIKIQLIWIYNALPAKGWPLPFKKRYLQLRADVVGNFLLSTNFFFNKMDEEQEIKYSGVIYKPYESSCVNPFSGLFYKQQ